MQNRKGFTKEEEGKMTLSKETLQGINTVFHA